MCYRFHNPGAAGTLYLACLLLGMSAFTACGGAEGAGTPVAHRGNWSPSQRKSDRQADLWLHYQHGVVDHFAVPFCFSELLGPGQDAGVWLDYDQPIHNPYTTSDQPAVRCRRSDSLALSEPLPLPIAEARGKWIRIFFWMKGNDAGARNNTWHCPDAAVIAKDASGRVLYDGDCYLKSQRTFPWHCFYTDRFVPREAAGIYLRVTNKFHGTAWFSTPSWEYINEANTYTGDEKQDPHTGSLSKNPLYEALAYHLGCGFGGRYMWRFVLGERIGMKGHTHDITSKAGLRAYYFEKAKHHPDEMNHAILHMQQMFRTGTKRGLLPPMEAGWLEHLARIIIDDQDPETGYWHDGKALSLGLTFHLCDMHFRYYGLPRPDRADRIYAGMDLGLKRVPRPEQIIRTTLMMQSTYVDEEGVRRKAAWNTAAYRYTEEPDSFSEKCFLGTTWDAIYLLRLASRYVDGPLQDEVYESVKAAFRYVLHKMVYEDGTFRQRDTDTHATQSTYMGHILRDCSWLERRVVPRIESPRVLLERGGEEAVLTWCNPVAAHNSLRVYAVPEGTAVSRVDESFLLGIVHRTDARQVYEMDPFVAVWHIRRATAARWGGSTELPSPTHWRGKKYLPWKLRKITYPLLRSNGASPLSIPLGKLSGKTLVVSATTWYGEESLPVVCR